MKRFTPIVAFLALVVAGCTGKEEVKADITLSGNSAQLVTSGINAAATGGEVTLNFTSALRWTATAEDTKAAVGWVVLNPPAGAAGEATVTVIINENPDLTARSAVITLSSGDVSKTIRVNQSAREAVHISQLVLSHSEVDLNEFETVQLVATVIPSQNDDDVTVTWSSSDPSVAAVLEDGTVTALKQGVAIITAKAGDLSATCTVNVNHIYVPVQSISLDQTELTMVLQQEVTLTATVNPIDADAATITWSSSDETVATVSQSGVVKAVGEGEAVITAEAGGKSATCAISVPHVVIEVESITLNQTEGSIYPGETIQLTATVNPSNADDQAVVWSSSDETIATVSDAGLVTAVAEGTATITATSANGKKADFALTVAHKPVPVESISLDQTELEIEAGVSAQLTATVNPSNADDPTVTWSSSNEAVATVDETGLVTAVAEGSATITAQAGEKTATCAVTVPHVAIAVESVVISQAEASIYPEETLQLTASVLPVDADVQTISWSSSDETIATVSETGLVTAIAEGTATITATSGNGKTATCALTVLHKVIEVESVSLNHTSISIKIDQEEKLLATINPTNADDQSVTWTSSDETIVTVSQEGVVKGVAEGEATITVTSTNGKTATCAVKVNPKGNNGEDLDGNIEVDPWK